MQPGFDVLHPAPAPTARRVPAERRVLGDRSALGGLEAAVRVFDLSADPTRPLSDRLRLHDVLGRHLDTVFRTRVTPPCIGRSGDVDCAPPVPVTSRVLRELSTGRDLLVHDDLLPSLRAAGVCFLSWDELTRTESAAVRRLFRERLHPLLTPMAVDGGRPFPTLADGSLTLTVRVRVAPGSRPQLGCVGVPTAAAPRVVSLGPGRAVTTETVISALLGEVFTGTQIVERACARVTRTAVGEGQRRPAPVTRLELERTAGDGTVATLLDHLGITHDQLYRVRSSLAIGDALSGPATRFDEEAS